MGDIRMKSCDECEKVWKIDSDNPEAVIVVERATIYIPKHIGEKIAIRGRPRPEAENLAGDYCSPKCLLKRIEKILSGE